MPSADFCPVTFSVTAERAARVTLGCGGTSTAFALVLNPPPWQPQLAREAGYRWIDPREWLPQPSEHPSS